MILSPRAFQPGFVAKLGTRSWVLASMLGDVFCFLQNLVKQMDDQPMLINGLLQRGFWFFARRKTVEHPKKLPSKHSTTVFCKKSQRESLPLQGIRFMAFPPVLNLQLKRFHFDMERMDMATRSYRELVDLQGF